MYSYLICDEIKDIGKNKAVIVMDKHFIADQLKITIESTEATKIATEIKAKCIKNAPVSHLKSGLKPKKSITWGEDVKEGDN